MQYMCRLPVLILTISVLVISSCKPAPQKKLSYSNPPLAGTEAQISIYSPTPDLSTIAPELLFTPTPDPNAFSIVARIEQEYSQEEIAKILFSKWLDHYLSKNISPVMRLDEYVINQVAIPSDQKCAKKLGATFVAEANITLKTTLPLLSTTYEHSDWVAGGGNIEDANHITELFSSVVSKSGNIYTLTVIMQVPMCD